MPYNHILKNFIMQVTLMQNFDIIIIGAGHAGCEAALASARLGAKTAVFTINLDSVANLPCNPSIGGTAKGHLVFEVDALGGEMARAADFATIQSRMLNRAKGPAVHSLRAQVDRRRYSDFMRNSLENQPNLQLKQAEIVDLVLGNELWVLTTHLGAKFSAKKVILATGTYLNATIFAGDREFSSGPDNLPAATKLSNSLEKLGIVQRRFKTGTPARVHKNSIDFTKLEPQAGDEPPTPFCSETKTLPENKVLCHITYTNAKTKKIILDNLDKSPIYSGEFSGIGPRYCPSLEDKMVRFKDKERHQIFIEPCGLNSNEMYLAGASSSLPLDVQEAFYKSIDGFENLEFMRPAYAIEYDCVDPTYLKNTLEFLDFDGLYGAGQYNGSSGYEEAAAQGLVAGVNAVRSLQNLDPLILSRKDGYIGVLIDDLTSKGCDDPYRMMTSRAEFRLVLRQDNAADRLSAIGYEVGLLSDERFEKFKAEQALKQEEIGRLKSTKISPCKELNELLNDGEILQTITLEQLLKRPGISYDLIEKFDSSRPENVSKKITEAAAIEVKYVGYVERQTRQVEKTARYDKVEIPPGVDFSKIHGMRLEARDKLAKHRPTTLGQALRIGGVNLNDILALEIELRR